MVRVRPRTHVRGLTRTIPGPARPLAPVRDGPQRPGRPRGAGPPGAPPARAWNCRFGRDWAAPRIPSYHHYPPSNHLLYDLSGTIDSTPESGPRATGRGGLSRWSWARMTLTSEDSRLSGRPFPGLVWSSFGEPLSVINAIDQGKR